MGIKNKIVKGGFYLALVKVYAQFLSIGVNIVLARLLVPEDFGLIALANTFIGLINVFINIGFGSSIIYQQDANNRQISTLYWLSQIIALLSFLIVLFTSHLAASFYVEPRLKMIIWALSLNILISPLFNIHLKLKERDLEFKLLSKITVFSSTIGALLGVVSAYLGYGVYALVVQTLATTSVRLVLSLLLIKWKPDFVFDFSTAKGMIWYSLKMKGASIILFFERNIDYLVMGKFFNSQVLGYYAFTYNIMYTPVKRVSYIFSDVLFPSFTSVKDQTQKIIQGYFKSIYLISLITFPAMTLLAFNAELIIQFVFGHKWDEAIPIVEVLCFAGAIQSISQIGGVIFASIGKPEIGIYFAIFRTGMTVSSVIIGSYYSILTVAYLLLISKIVSYIALMFTIRHHIWFKWINFLKHLDKQIITVVILAGIYLVFMNVGNSFVLLRFVCMMITAAILTLVFHSKILKEIVVIITKASP